MAVRFDATGDFVRRTTNIPVATACTCMAWFQITVDRNAISAFMSYDVDTNDGGVVATAADGTTLTLYTSGSVAGAALTVGTWYHLTLVCDGTGSSNMRVYLNGVLNMTGVSFTLPFTTLTIGGTLASTAQWLNGRAAAVKVWNAALTTNEMLQEMRTYLPVRLANLNAWSPLLVHTDVKDYSINANHWTAGGTLTTEQGPPIAWAPRQPVRDWLAPAVVVLPPRPPVVRQQAVMRGSAL